MNEMNREQFLRKWEDTHAELSLGKKNNIKHPEDKNIWYRGKIPGKRLIEKQAMDKRADDLRHMLLDVVATRSSELLDADIIKMVSLAIRALPQQINANVNTFDTSNLEALYAKANAVDAEFKEEE